MNMGPEANDEVLREFFKHQHMLMDYILYLVPHAQDAEDIFQEVAVVVCRKTENVPDKEHFGSWCRGVARNMAKHYWRDKKRQKVIFRDDLHDVVDLAYAEADADLETLNERRHFLDYCVEKLPTKAQDILRTHYVKNMKIVDIARQIKRSAESVRMILMRIRKRLQDCVEKQALEERG